MKASTIALVAAFILAVAASFWFGGEYVRRKGLVPSGRPDTVYIERWVRDTVYQPKDSIIVRWETAYLPVHDTTYLRDTLQVVDSVLVDVPISEKHYVSENYRATVRGYRAELADIWIKQKETTITVPYRKRWGFTAGPQVGVGITPQGWQPYAGLGVTFGYSF